MFLHLSVILFTRGGVSVGGGALCPGRSMSRGSLSRGFPVQGHGDSSPPTPGIVEEHHVYFITYNSFDNFVLTICLATQSSFTARDPREKVSTTK